MPLERLLHLPDHVNDRRTTHGAGLMVSEGLWAALALVLVLEGLLPFLSPGSWRRAVAHIAEQPDHRIRLFALLVILAGLTMLWL